MTKQVFVIRNVGTDVSFKVISTVYGAANIVSTLGIETNSIWDYTSEKDEMNRYNEMMSNEDYKRQIEQHLEVYKGTNLDMAVSAFHKRLNIMPKPKSFELYQKFEV